jgi:hypothetical protein
LILNGIIERTTNKDSINVLNININKEEDIKYINILYINVIHENTFNGLTNLKKIEKKYFHINLFSIMKKKETMKLIMVMMIKNKKSILSKYDAII